MAKIFLLLLCLVLAPFAMNAQDAAVAYIKSNAARVENPEVLSDSVYQALSPYNIILMGEMHGTNEPAQWVGGLANLFARHGDSVLLGLEIPSEYMGQYLASPTPASVYESDFFRNCPYQDGRQSLAWAGLISTLTGNSRVKIFFFDFNKGESESDNRDSLMFLKIKRQVMLHPGWKTITLSGNYHARLREGSMASYLERDEELRSIANLCALNHYYLSGSCRANFGHGLEERKLERSESVYDTALGSDRYLLLLSAKSGYPYTGFYYTRAVTAAKMVTEK